MRDTTINKSIATPMYVQVANELRKEILLKKYGEFGCIGTHSQLVQRFKVSMRTIRTAVQILQNEGLVEIHQGKGTFVRSAMFIDKLQNLTGISDMLSSLGMEREVAVPVLKIINTPEKFDPDVKKALGAKCLFIRRIVLLRGEPVAVADMYLPREYAAILSRKEVEADTVYGIYQRKMGIVLGKGKQTICAIGANEDLSKSLGLSLDSPLLQIRRRAYDSSGRLIEFMILSYKASKYCFEVELDLKKNKNNF